jgi:outer membrane receptor protein involved in Fe transport
MVSRNNSVRGLRHAASLAILAFAIGAPNIGWAQTRPDPESEDAATEIEEVVVTGSRIRGAPPSSPVIRLSQEDMRNAGNANLGDAIRQVPQNFSGGSNPAIGMGAGPDGKNVNSNSSSQLNLRGLGQDASLTLLNGRRLAYSSLFQGVDITAIPLDAVDRIEIVADGSSALYGADAVGGVANIVLKQDFDGVSATARFGAATGGGAEQQQYSLVGGKSWDRGGFIATLNYENSTEINARDRSYTSAQSPSQIIYPPIEAFSGVFSAHQRLTDALTLKLDATYSDRTTASTTAYTLAPYTTDGSASSVDNVSFTIAPNIDIALPGGWAGNASIVYGKDNTRQLGTVFTAGVAGPPETLKYDNTTLVYEVFGEGPVARLPAGDVRLAIGGGLRQIGLDTFRSPATTLSPDQDVRYAFGELYVPLLGGPEGRGSARLGLTAAARYEDYDQSGDIVVPKVGLAFSLNDDWDLKASWSKSFKSPVLNQQYYAELAILFDAALFGATGVPAGSTVLYRTGGNPDLAPERAESWSATAEFHPESLPGLNVAISYFDVDYQDRVVTPIASVVGALANPLYAQFVTLNPSPAQLSDIVANAGGGFVNASSGAYDPGAVIGVLDSRYANAARQTIQGIDLQASYAFDLDRYGSLTAVAAATYLSSEQTLIPGQPTIDLSGTIFNPPKVRGSLGFTWQIDRLTFSPQALYSGSLTDNRLLPNVRIDDQVTFNLTGRYDIPTAIAGLAGLTLSASVLNITNEAPEPIATTAIYNTPYESTNYSPIGRFVGVSLTGRW